MSARIGPNAVTRLAQALRERFDEDLTQRVFLRAGAADLLSHPPDDMVDERRVSALFVALRELLDDEATSAVAARAGELTADYLLANRIPALVQRLLRVLPIRISAAILLQAIARNAWTFAGSGRFDSHAGRICRIVIVDDPIGLPDGAWHRQVFERLFRQLVCAQTVVRLDEGVTNDRHCHRYEIRFPGTGTAVAADG